MNHFNSTIKIKYCKCSPDCKQLPSIGCDGFFYSHLPQEIKDKEPFKYRRNTIIKKGKAKKSTLSRKLHSISSSKLENENKKIEQDKLQQWFILINMKLTGTCQCGCGNPSSKNDPKYYRHSCCHLFPKKTFKSIQYHLDNYVERAFWGGCHSVLDDTSISRWPAMKDWEDIKQKFKKLSPLLTEQEKATKFYRQFEALILA